MLQSVLCSAHRGAARVVNCTRCASMTRVLLIAALAAHSVTAQGGFRRLQPQPQIDTPSALWQSMHCGASKWLRRACTTHCA